MGSKGIIPKGTDTSAFVVYRGICVHLRTSKALVYLEKFCKQFRILEQLNYKLFVNLKFILFQLKTLDSTFDGKRELVEVEPLFVEQQCTW